MLPAEKGWMGSEAPVANATTEPPREDDDRRRVAHPVVAAAGSESFVFIKHLILIGVFVFVFVFFYSSMGIGVWWVIVTDRWSVLSSVLFGLFLLFLLFAHISDLSSAFWSSVLGTIYVVSTIACGGAGVVLGIDAYPYGPLCLFAMGLPAWLVCIHVFLKEGQNLSASMRHFVWPLVACGVLTGAAWLAFVLWRPKNGWNRARERYGQRFSNNGLACRRTYEESWMDDDEIRDLEPYARCQEVFLVWVAPWCAAWILGITAGIAYFFGRPRGSLLSKLFWSVCLLVVGAWCAASLAGAGHGIASTILAVVFSLSVGVMLLAFYQFGGSDDTKNVLSRLLEEHESLRTAKKKYYDPYEDAWQGLSVVALGPFFVLVYLPVEWLHERRRRLSNNNNNDRNMMSTSCLVLTNAAQKRVEKMMSEWQWTSVLRWACVVGFANIAVVVIVAKFTVLLMSIVVSRAENMTIPGATGIIVAVGLTLFLLPPVPGAPIYLAAGVLLTVVVKANGWTAFAGIIYAACVCLVIKLVACTFQHKLIGVPLRRSLYVKKLVGINSTLIRTTRLVLEERGLSIAKVALLVGGPDWPTSVLCGILDLSLFPVLLGTLPVWLLIWPTVVGGAFLVIDESTAPTLSAIFVGLAALVQSGSLVVAAIFLNMETTKRAAEIAKIPLDKRVEEDAANDAKRREHAKKVTRWGLVPLPGKLALILAVFCLIVSCYMTTLFPSSCFREFAVDDTVSKHLRGRWTRIVKPPGLVAIALFLLALFLYLGFVLWASYAAAGPIEDADPDVSKEMISTKERATASSEENDDEDKGIPPDDETLQY